jgi:arsenate reductase
VGVHVANLCPAVPGKRIVDWDLEDPKGKDLEVVRRIVDDIDERVRTLLHELGVTPSH